MADAGGPPTLPGPDGSQGCDDDRPVIATTSQNGAPQVVAGLVERLRTDLETARFTIDGVGDLLGSAVSEALRRDQILPAERATRGDDSSIATLIRLFTLGRTVSVGALDAALPSVRTEGMTRLALVEVTAGRVRATVDLRPYADERHQWWLASDLSQTVTHRPLESEHVLGIGPASLTLSSWIPRVPVRAAVDLGTGSGVQALHLSTHAEHVVATDVSERALAFARFNAALAGRCWDIRRGDLFGPLAGERFDLIVSNPPFVITPRVPHGPIFTYRDSGRPGDTVMGDLVSRVATHLNPGGIAQFIGNWQLTSGTSWEAPWRTWLDGTGLDAWVLRRELVDVATYAQTWLQDSGHDQSVSLRQGEELGQGREGYDSAGDATGETADRWFEAWLDMFEAQDVDRVAFGVITLQRPVTSRAPWTDLSVADGPVATPMGPTVLAGLRARTWLVEHGDDAVLSRAWRCAADVTLERHTRPWLDRVELLLLRQGGGLRRCIALDEVTAGFVGVCDGELTAGRALTAIAAVLGRSEASIREQAMGTVQALVADGLLVPADPPEIRVTG